MQVLKIEPSPDERVLTNVAYGGSKPFGLAITDRALYICDLDRWAVAQPWVIRRLPFEQVRQVVVRRTRPLGIVLLSVLMILFGGSMTFLMLKPLAPSDPGMLMVWPIAILIGGLVLPFSARGRQTLRVALAGRRDYRWKPPLFAGAASKQLHRQMMEQIVAGFRAVGIEVLHV